MSIFLNYLLKLYQGIDNKSVTFDQFKIPFITGVGQPEVKALILIKLLLTTFRYKDSL